MMICNLRILGVALLAVLALSAVVATAASAEGRYTASTYPTTGTAVSPAGNDRIGTEAGSVECAAHFQGNLPWESSYLTLKVKYTNCKAFGFATATVSMGSCDFLLSTPTKEGFDAWKDWFVDIECTNPSEPIQVVAGNCELTIGAQTIGGGIDILTYTGAGDLSLEFTLLGINYTVTKDGFLCPFAGTGAKTGGTYLQWEPITFDSTNGAVISVG